MPTTPTLERHVTGAPEFTFDPWRHGGWYVGGVRYPSGAVGCVSRNYADGEWRIVCDERPFDEQPTFRSRYDAAYFEAELAMGPDPDVRWFVRVRFDGDKRFQFMTPDGGSTNRRVHAAMCTHAEREKAIAQIRESANDLGVAEISVVATVGTGPGRVVSAQYPIPTIPTTTKEPTP